MHLELGTSCLVSLSTFGVKFINILQAVFVTMFCTDFLYLQTVFVFVWQKEIGKKAACKLLVKVASALTTFSQGIKGLWGKLNIISLWNPRIVFTFEKTWFIPSLSFLKLWDLAKTTLLINVTILWYFLVNFETKKTIITWDKKFDSQKHDYDVFNFRKCKRL